ncbi:Dabb family protein [Photorhabdus heterorhabditis]|uniref:Dabb family protein n=1 Tax=Photorhabdus heterorhabditis TaxID=880156 RepID=UPI00092F473F
MSSVEWGGNISSENKNKGFTHAITMTFDDHKAISNYLYPSSFKLLLCWLHSLTPVTELSMLPGIHSLAVAKHLEIHRIYTTQRMTN